MNQGTQNIEQSRLVVLARNLGREAIADLLIYFKHEHSELVRTVENESGSSTDYGLKCAAAKLAYISKLIKDLEWAKNNH